MSIKKEEIAKFEKLGEFFKKYWNIQHSPNEFRESMKKEFPKKDIEMFVIYFIEKMGQNPKESNSLIEEYLFSIISEDFSIVFADLDLENPYLVIGARKIIEMSKVDSFNTLPVYSEKSSNCALNALIIVLLNENKAEMRKEVRKLAQSTYFSILISAGQLFHPEKYKQAQLLYKEKDPFDLPIHQLPITHAHLAMALFSRYSMEQLTDNDNFKNLFMMFAIFQLINMGNFNLKVINNNSNRTLIQSAFINYYLSDPSYILSYFLVTFPKRQKQIENVFQVFDVSSFSNNNAIENDEPFFHFYSNYNYNHNYQSQFSPFANNNNENDSDEDFIKNIYSLNKDEQKTSAVFNFNIIHDQLPNGLFPTYESVLDLLSRKPEKIQFETIIEEGLHYPSFVPEIASIFMSKLKEKDFKIAAILGKQILKRNDDIRHTWIAQLVFFPIMKELNSCLNEIEDEYEFEVLFILFISFYEGCTKLGDEVIFNSLRKFNSTIDDHIRLYLENFLNQTNELVVNQTYFENDKKPINRLVNSLKRYKDTNDIDTNELMKYPYLFISAFIWGIKTVHPNSLKLLSVKFPNYKICKRFFVYFSSCHQNEKEKTSLKSSPNIFFTIPTTDFSYELLTRFPPSNESELRLILLHNLSYMSTKETRIKEVQGILISWRAWIKTYSIEKFILMLLETIVWSGDNKADQVKNRNNFIFAERILATVFLNPIRTNVFTSINYNQMEFDIESKKFIKKNSDNQKIINKEPNNTDDIFKRALWTTLDFIRNYQGSFDDGMGFASFCLLLIISIKNEWKSEFQKALDFSFKMMEASDWKSLKYSFFSEFLYISMSILEFQKLIRIDMFDMNFLQVNWRFGINYFYLQSEIKRLEESNLISLK